MMKRLSAVLLCLVLLFASAAEENVWTDRQSAAYRLMELGYYQGDLDAADSAEFAVAVSNFQKANGLPVTGSFDSRTGECLFGENALTMEQYSANCLAEDVYDFALTSGDSGKKVKQLQGYLTELGYYTSETDGNYDTEVAVSVGQFQMVNGLPVTGTADSATLSKLTSPMAVPAFGFEGSFTLSYGNSGSRVKQLQISLAEMGYFHGVCSGEFGLRTKEAVMEFQQRNGLSETGTWDVYQTLYLQSGLAIDKSTSRENLAGVEITEGDENYLVLEIEQHLYSLGFLKQYADNLYDADTSAAVSLFQEANGLEITGNADPETRAALLEESALDMAYLENVSQTTPLAVGSYGYSVLKLTQKLADLGYPMETTMFYDENVKTAVEVFQTGAGLTVTGNADEVTRSRMNEPQRSYEEIYPEYCFWKFRTELEKCVGKPFEAGKTGPESFGNGGLTYYIYAFMQTAIPPTTQLQYENARRMTTFSRDVNSIQPYSQIFLLSGETIFTAIAVGDSCVFCGADRGAVVKVPFAELTADCEFLGTIAYFSTDGTKLG